LAQKHDKVTCATKQIEWDSKDTDAINSCPRKVPIKLVRYTLQMEHLKAFSVEKFTLDGLIYPQTFFTCLFVFFVPNVMAVFQGGIKCRWGMKKSRFLTNIWLLD